MQKKKTTTLSVYVILHLSVTLFVPLVTRSLHASHTAYSVIKCFWFGNVWDSDPVLWRSNFTMRSSVWVDIADRSRAYRNSSKLGAFLKQINRTWTVFPGILFSMLYRIPIVCEKMNSGLRWRRSEEAGSWITGSQRLSCQEQWDGCFYFHHTVALSIMRQVWNVNIYMHKERSGALSFLHLNMHYLKAIHLNKQQSEDGEE